MLKMFRGYRKLVHLGTAMLLVLAWTTLASSQEVYTIHVSSYRNQGDAEQETADFRLRGLESFTRKENVADQGVWFRVYVGRFATRGRALALAELLKERGLLSVHSNYRVMQLNVSDNLAAEPDSKDVLNSSQDVSAFRETVEGAYVGSYRDKDMADRQAQGLSQQGWPAYVEEGKVQDVIWYRVYLMPQTRSGAEGQAHFIEIIADVSRTVPRLEPGQPIPELCLGLTKFQVLTAVLRKLAMVTPGRKVDAALRSTGFERYARESPYATLLWGPGHYQAGALSPAVDMLLPSLSFAPLDYAIMAADTELSARSGTRHLIIVSDFMVPEGFGQPLKRALELKHKYGPDLCLTTIYVGANANGVRLARDMAQLSECGNVYDGCLLLSDQTYFDALVRNVFFWPGLGS